ncbi:MAG: hypothetical protein HAW58_05240 [Candidatus Thioglobus sp.]|nr:hypothetical protein [Candidatus Thioglobus sp.]
MKIGRGAAIVAQQFHTTELTGKNILITLGASVEAIDPVRYISNHSSGKMGMALVNNCIELGAQVTCIYAKIQTELNQRASNIQALSAKKMHKAVMENIAEQDIFISCAAVADFSPENIAKDKIKKNADDLKLILKPNPDILQDVCKLTKKPLTIGFAAETKNPLENAQIKLKNKGCDVIILNDVSGADFGLNVDENEVTFLSQNYQQKIAKTSKQKIAKKILEIFIRKFL